jgi:1,4-alpha-glucan branching enzyme
VEDVKKEKKKKKKKTKKELAKLASTTPTPPKEEKVLTFENSREFYIQTKDESSEKILSMLHETTSLHHKIIILNAIRKYGSYEDYMRERESVDIMITKEFSKKTNTDLTLE